MSGQVEMNRRTASTLIFPESSLLFFRAKYNTTWPLRDRISSRSRYGVLPVSTPPLYTGPRRSGGTVHGPTGIPRGAVEVVEGRGRFSQQRGGGTRSRDPFGSARLAKEDVSSRVGLGRRVQLREMKPS